MVYQLRWLLDDFVKTGTSTPRRPPDLTYRFPLSNSVQLSHRQRSLARLE